MCVCVLRVYRYQCVAREAETGHWIPWRFQEIVNFPMGGGGGAQLLSSGS